MEALDAIETLQQQQGVGEVAGPGLGAGMVVATARGRNVGGGGSFSTQLVLDVLMVRA